MSRSKEHYGVLEADRELSGASGRRTVKTELRDREHATGAALSRGKTMRASKLLVQLTIYYLVIALRGVRRAEAVAGHCAAICRSAASSS